MLHQCRKNMAKYPRFTVLKVSVKIEGHKYNSDSSLILILKKKLEYLVHLLGFSVNSTFIEQGFHMENSLVKDATMVEHLKTYFNIFSQNFS